MGAQCSIYDDSESEDEIVVNEPSGFSQRRGSSTQYDINEASIKSEITKFLAQPPDHFAKCEFCASTFALKYILYMRLIKSATVIIIS